MKRKLQVALNEDSQSTLEGLLKEVNSGFNNGYISCSDLVNEIILTAKIDVRDLQMKHMNIRKSLRLLASQKDIDIDLAIKGLMEMKAKGKARTLKNLKPIEEVQA